MSVVARGPIFDGDKTRIYTRQFIEEAKDTIAREGVNMVKSELRPRHGLLTGEYRSRIRTDRRGADRVIHDGKSVKGPWLEGVSSRNTTTRFKGYRIFRRVRNRVTRLVIGSTKHVRATYMGRLNGNGR